jgi:ammonia channel protein AmtB
MALRIIQIIFLASFLVYTGLYIFFGFTLATVPNKVTGAIFCLNLHGHIVYLNRSQHQLLKAFGSLAFLFGAIFALIGAIMVYRHGQGHRFSDQGPRQKSL